MPQNNKTDVIDIDLDPVSEPPAETLRAPVRQHAPTPPERPPAKVVPFPDSEQKRAKSASRDAKATALTGRTLPHSIEAEEYLLSCCLLDGAEVVSRCLEARIRPESFYHSAHGIIFERLIDLYNRQAPIDISVVAEELKNARQLDQLGGYSFLLQVSSRIPTTAQASYFIDKVREQALLRDIIRSATGAVEDCYNFSGQIDEFISESRRKLEGVFDGGSIANIANLMFNPDEKVPEARVAYYLAGTQTCRAGNITTLTAAVKAGKSATVGALLAAAMARDENADCLGFAGRNVEKLPLLHFDTEQSREDWHALVMLAAKRAGIERPPAWLKSYHLKGRPRAEKRAVLERAASGLGRKHGRFFAIIIDGVADMVVDVNDPKESFGFIERLEVLAEKYSCPVICVIHLNPGKDSEKSRGHLGSELERKAESNILLEKNEDEITTIYAPKQRKKAIPKSEGVRFKWNSELGRHATLTKEEAEKHPVQRKPGRNPGGRPARFTDAEVLKLFPRGHAKREGIGMILRRARERLGPGMKESTFYEYRGRLIQAGSLCSDDHDGKYFIPLPDDFKDAKGKK